MPGIPAHPGRILLIALLVFLLMEAAGAQGDGTLTRGQTFTVTVVGLPRTAYDIWPRGTHDMTGEPGDQPPIIVAGQADVVQDPPGGPYTIGSHPIRVGGTILDDVPPTSSVVPATAYYAQVRTDASGRGVVLFQTSHDTATGRQFHITAQNPADPDEDVGVVLGLPARTPGSVIPLPMPTTMATPFLPVSVPEPTVTPTPTATPVSPITPSPVETPRETTPVQKIPLPAAVGTAAAGILLFGMGRARGR